VSDVVATVPINNQSVMIVGKERNHPASLMVAVIFKRLDLPEPADTPTVTSLADTVSFGRC
jgi:hypothetical protein